MPTYEYQCKKCGATFDVFQSIKDRPLTRTACEACGKTQPVRRLVSAGGGILFKGSGFYETDYRSEGYKKSAQAETSSSTATATADTTKPTETTATSKPSAEDGPKKPAGASSRKKVAV